MGHLVSGLILTGLGVYGMVSWWSLFGLVMRGVIPFFLLIFGLVAILAACRRLGRSASANPIAVYGQRSAAGVGAMNDIIDFDGKEEEELERSHR